jgi:hypothetical protein
MTPASKKSDEEAKAEDKQQVTDEALADERSDSEAEPETPPGNWEDRPDEGPEVGVEPEVNAEEQEELANKEDPAIAPPGYVAGEGTGQSPSQQKGYEPAPGTQG